MVKKGGTRRKIAIEMIQKRDSLRVTCTKRREGLFSKASQLCLLSDAQVAILATPPSSASNASFYSFGHSSVDGVVSAFLSGQRPVSASVQEDNKAMREDVGICLTRKNLGLGFWWNNESLARSENPQELSDAIDSMWTLLSNLKELRADEAFVNDHEDLKKIEKSDQTLNLQSTSAICCIPDDLPENINEITQEPDQTLNLQSTTSTICCVPDDLVVLHDEEQDQILSICESFCVTDNNNTNAALPEVNLDYDQDMDIDQLIDFETSFESSLDDWFTDNTTHQELEETTTASLLRFSDFFHDFAKTIAAL
ncbi:Transcription factor MADS-box [Arabidopsis thaliana x Arabidopsis arenosa]|uniref:Transcription factor MADS-box n=1 Tax=Arabidopsis thaliana x Arabidopsis arenosa TaxID=1240361 RepID=A0A8T1XP53_9BRAS|nr:Transcription factor MADS-box [Arabidopsis thaliana x Arabidopsis arenosa]